MPGDPLCLALETSNPSADPAVTGEVALGRCADWSSPAAPIEVLAREQLSPRARHDDALAPAIDRLFTSTGLAPTDLARVAVSIGPGGYSALRISVAAARMIAEATGAGCVGVETAAVAARADGLPARFAVLLASKRDTVWATVYERASATSEPKELVAGGLLDASALTHLAAQTPFDAIAADAFLPDAFHDAASRSGWATLPLTLGAVALLHASRGRATTPPEGLLPLYPREAEAVRKWRELGRAARP